MDTLLFQVTRDSPPGHIGLHLLHHGYRGLVDFDEGPTEDLPQSQHLDYLHHFGTDTFNPNRRGLSMFTKLECYVIVYMFGFLLTQKYTTTAEFSCTVIHKIWFYISCNITSCKVRWKRVCHWSNKEGTFHHRLSVIWPWQVLVLQTERSSLGGSYVLQFITSWI